MPEVTDRHGPTLHAGQRTGRCTNGIAKQAQETVETIGIGEGTVQLADEL